MATKLHFFSPSSFPNIGMLLASTLCVHTYRRSVVPSHTCTYIGRKNRAWNESPEGEIERRGKGEKELIQFRPQQPSSKNPSHYQPTYPAWLAYSSLICPFGSGSFSWLGWYPPPPAEKRNFPPPFS